jgi:hypothetical protein
MCVTIGLICNLPEEGAFPYPEAMSLGWTHNDASLSASVTG